MLAGVQVKVSHRGILGLSLIGLLLAPPLLADSVEDDFGGDAHGVAHVALPLEVELTRSVQEVRRLKSLGNHSGAVRVAESVAARWDAASDKERQRAAESVDDTGQSPSLHAVGEALFLMALEKKRAAQELPMPVYRGSRGSEALLHHVNTVVKSWSEQRRERSYEAVVAFKRIVDTKPRPSMSWVVQAGAEVTTLWADFMRGHHSRPLPKSAAGDPATLRQYNAALQQLSKPYREQAKGAALVCMAYQGTCFRPFVEAQACDEFLRTNYPDDYHPIDEIVPRPVHGSPPDGERFPALALPESSLAPNRGKAQP